MRLHPEGEVAEFLAFPLIFEKTEVSLVSAFLRPGMSVIDVGANIGMYSILASLRTKPRGKVFAFEPSTESATRLVRNLALNHCDNVTVFRIALSDKADGRMSLVSDRGFGDAYRYLDSKADAAGGETVSVTTLDGWAAEHAVGPADFLKVDIEGGEYRMFLGAREYLAASPDIVIMFECESDWCARAGYRPEDLHGLLRSVGFSLYAWQPKSRRWDTDPNAIAGSSMLWAARNRAYLPEPEVGQATG
jgi:FkbM family methyltransferase